MESMRRLERILRKHGLSIELKEISGRGHEKKDKTQELDHYECRLKKSGEEMKITLPADSLKRTATPWDVLFVLAMDASACAMLEGFDEFHREIGESLERADGASRGMKEFREEYEHRCSQSRRLRDFLGESAYMELRREADWEDLIN